jgi:hypothetical protein
MTQEFIYRQLKTMPAAEALYSLLVDKERALSATPAAPLLLDGKGTQQDNAQV